MNTKTLRITSRITAFVILVTAALFSGSSAQAAAFKLTDIYNPAKINSIELTIPPASEQALNSSATAKIYTAASVTITAAGYTMGPIQIGLRLKGSTSLQLLRQTPSFKIAFNWGTALKGARFLGLKNMTLNAMTQDESKLHEFSAYKLFNAMSVQAPRTGWAALKINGVSRGLYLNVESYDDIFIGSRFKDTTLHLYEGIALNDFKPGKADGTKNTGAFLVKEGWKAAANKNDLQKLIEVANYSSSLAWWNGMAKYTDRSQMIRMWAVENFVGHWDGYSGPLNNNYFIRSNITGKFVMLPWGADQTFGENRQTKVLLDDYFYPMDKPQSGFPWIEQAFKKTAMDRGLLFKRCLAYTPCRVEYLTQLKAVSIKATTTKLVASMKAASTVIAPYSNTSMKNEQVRTQAWVGKQQSKVSALLKLYKIK